MAGYIGSKSSVTQVDGYSEAEADAEFVTKTGDTMSGNLDVTGTVTADGLGVVSSGTNSQSLAEFSSASGLRAKIASDGGDDGYMYLYDANDANTVSFRTDGNHSFINGGGNFGIGTSSPSEKLHISTGVNSFPATSGSTQTGAALRLRGGDNAVLDMGLNSVNTWLQATDKSGLHNSYNICLNPKGGNVLVGTTTASAGSNVGFRVYPTGNVFSTVQGNYAGYFNRLGSDGEVIKVLKDGSTVGTIGNIGSALVFRNVNEDGITILTDNGQAKLVSTNSSGLADNDGDIGAASYRWDDVYATNGTIQTSDFNEKQDIASLTATEMLVGKRISALFKTFRWKDSVAENGDNARTHTGVIAQDVQAAFTAEGLDAGDYALFISSTWWETQTEVPAVEAVEAVEEVVDEDGNVTTEAVEAVEAKDAYTRTDTYDTEAEAPEGATSKTRMGIRYPELLSFVAAYNEQRFASIEARLTALEA
jgi:hypothetical protein